jgi:hypothetical protein
MTVRVRERTVPHVTTLIAGTSAAVIVEILIGVVAHVQRGSAPVARVLPAPPAPSSVEPEPRRSNVDPQTEFQRAKGRAIRSCESDGGVVAMSFGYGVVCIPERCGATVTHMPDPDGKK